MKKVFFILFIGAMFLPLIAIGQGPEPIITDPQQIVGLLNSILGYVWTLMASIVILMLLYAGFKFITAAGSEDNIKMAKEMLKYSLIGIVVMLLSGGVMTLLANFLKAA